jgi:hypothetical protein
MDIHDYITYGGKNLIAEKFEVDTALGRAKELNLKL